MSMLSLVGLFQSKPSRKKGNKSLLKTGILNSIEVNIHLLVHWDRQVLF